MHGRRAASSGATKRNSLQTTGKEIVMLQLARTVRNLLWARKPARRPARKAVSPRPCLLSLEPLEERALLAASFTGAFSGVAFVDANGSGAFNSGESLLPGVNVNLTGTTTAGAPVNALTT